MVGMVHLNESPACTAGARQRVLVVDTSTSHYTVQQAGWWESFRRRSLALYAQDLNTLPSNLNVEFVVVYAPPPVSADELVRYAQSLFPQQPPPATHASDHPGGEQGMCFAVIHESSAALDAVALVVSPGREAQCGTLIGPRFLVRWAHEFAMHPERINDIEAEEQENPFHLAIERKNGIAVVNDENGVARRLSSEAEIRAHHSTDYTHTTSQQCRCEWHALRRRAPPLSGGTSAATNSPPHTTLTIIHKTITVSQRSSSNGIRKRDKNTVQYERTMCV